MASRASKAPKTDPSNKEETRVLRFRRLKAWFWQEMQRQAANRYQMAIDEDYYDSLQFTAEESAEIIRRGQAPVVWNEVKPMVDWLIGTERRARTDFKVLARNDDSPEAERDATIKTKLLKYFEDVNRAGFERSQAFDDAVKAGLGWIETGIRSDPEHEPVFQRAESWRNILYDSLGPRRDLEDSRYLFRFRWVDVDVAKAYFPGNEAAIDAAASCTSDERYMEWWMGRRMEEYGDQSIMLPSKWSLYDSSSWLNNPRDRVMLIEAWTKEPSTKSNGNSPSTYDRTYMRMRCTIMTDTEIIADDWSPYKHNRFPFVPVWCYRRKRDNAPYGVVRPVRGPQDVTNKSMSKAVWLVAARQIRLEKSAVDPKVMTIDEIRDENQAPDGVVILADGGLQKFKDVEHSADVEGNLKLAERGLNTIRESGGVTSENRGLESNAQSGKAVIAKANQGSVTTAEIFDNLLFSHQHEGELVLSLAEQYCTDAKIFSVVGDRSRLDYVKINTPDGNGGMLNDITKRTCQFVIGEQAWRQALAQAAFESMMELMGQLASISPTVVQALLPSVLELADLPNKQTMLAQVRQALGQRDPDTPASPEEEAQDQQQQQQQKQLQEAQFKAQLAKLQASTTNEEAKAMLTRVTAFYEGLQAAQVAATVPNVAPIADEILRAAGFHDAGGQTPSIPAPQVVAPAQTQAAIPPPVQTDGAAVGARSGIETQRDDGVIANG